MTTSPIFCAASAIPTIWPLVVSASPTAARTTLVVRVSCWLISAIELDSSPAAAAALSTLADASFEACPAASACREVCSDAPNRPFAVSRIALTPPVTTVSTLSTRSRNETSAVSTMARRVSRSFMAMRCRSAWRRSVMSSCVATQPPPANGALEMAMKRPLCSRTLEVVLPLVMLLSRSAMY